MTKKRRRRTRIPGWAADLVRRSKSSDVAQARQAADEMLVTGCGKGMLADLGLPGVSPAEETALSTYLAIEGRAALRRLRGPSIPPFDVPAALRVLTLRRSVPAACRRHALAPARLRRRLRSVLDRGGWSSLKRFGYYQYDLPADLFGREHFADGPAIAVRAIKELAGILGRPRWYDRHAPEAAWPFHATMLTIRVREHFDQHIPVLLVEERNPPASRQLWPRKWPKGGPYRLWAARL